MSLSKDMTGVMISMPTWVLERLKQIRKADGITYSSQIVLALKKYWKNNGDNGGEFLK